ncbi:hypothetical protein EYF80_001601 [Liparis tanakae]|uniref:Uncharacterized protein n=1 Tax=Liparis tanakae TaxID=230148 RepID=A0A4Z2JCY2_9TELE|nr:hypothetical protein EYF80_001601 [Liparis tanakae]
MSVRLTRAAPEASTVPARSYLQEHGVRNVLPEADLHEAVLHEAVLRNLHNARRGHLLVVAHTALLDLEQLHKQHKAPLVDAVRLLVDAVRLLVDAVRLLVDAVRLRTELRVSARKDHCLPHIELPVVGALLRGSPTAMGGTILQIIKFSCIKSANYNNCLFLGEYGAGLCIAVLQNIYVHHSPPRFFPGWAYRWAPWCKVVYCMSFFSRYLTCPTTISDGQPGWAVLHTKSLFSSPHTRCAATTNTITRKTKTIESHTRPNPVEYLLTPLMRDSKADQFMTAALEISLVAFVAPWGLVVCKLSDVCIKF